MQLSEAEYNALRYVNRHGSILVTKIDSKNSRDVFGEIVPGMAVFKKLEKKGLLVFTEEDEDEEGFAFTEEVYITELGVKTAKALKL
jgi:hypothetical protein